MTAKRDMGRCGDAGTWSFASKVFGSSMKMRKTAAALGNKRLLLLAYVELCKARQLKKLIDAETLRGSVER